MKLRKSLTVILVLSGLLNLFAKDKNSNIYIDSVTKFQIVKSNNWFFSNFDDVLRSYENMKFKDDLYIENMKYGIKPMVIISKYKEPYIGINSAIAVYKCECVEIGKSDFDKMNEILKYGNSVVFDFQMIENPKIKKICDLNAVYAKYSFKTDILHKKELIVINEIYIIKKEKYYIQIETQASEINVENDLQEINSILETVKI